MVSDIVDLHWLFWYELMSGCNVEYIDESWYYSQNAYINTAIARTWWFSLQARVVDFYPRCNAPNGHGRVCRMMALRNAKCENWTVRKRESRIVWKYDLSILLNDPRKYQGFTLPPPLFFFLGGGGEGLISRFLFSTTEYSLHYHIQLLVLSSNLAYRR